MQAIQVGKVLEPLRSLARMTQADVCAQVGISINFLSLVENGHKDVSPAVAGRLAAVLGVPVSFLYVLADATNGHPAVALLYSVVREDLARLLTARVGERLEKHPLGFSEEEKRCYWAWWEFDRSFPENAPRFMKRFTSDTTGAEKASTSATPRDEPSRADTEKRRRARLKRERDAIGTRHD